MKNKGFIFICLLICLFSIASVVASDVNDTDVVNNQVLSESTQKIDELNDNDECSDNSKEGCDEDGDDNDILSNIYTNDDVEIMIADEAENNAYCVRIFTFNELTGDINIYINNSLKWTKHISEKDYSSGSTWNFIYTNDLNLKPLNTYLLKVTFDKYSHECYSYITPSKSEDQIAGTFTDLANEIKNAENELILTKNYTYSINDSNYEYGITIDKPITINGEGFVINGNNLSRALYISANNVFLKNIIFTNCCVDFGKNINSYGIDDLAGGIYWEGNNGVLINSTFINCAAASGGAIYCRGKNLNISDSNFINNSAYIYNKHSGGCGGAIWFGSLNGIIDNCKFINNSIFNENLAESWGYGGSAIFGADDNILICNSYFSNNYITSILLGADYGTISNSQFINNTGGAIKSVSNEAKLIKSIFINNSAKTDVISWSSGYVYDCIYENNNGKISIPQLETKIIVNDISTYQNSGKYLIIYLKDNYNNPLKGFRLTVDLNNYKSIITDNYGKAKLSINGLTIGQYITTINFEGNEYYMGSSTTAKVTIHKLNPTKPVTKTTLTLKKVTVKRSAKKLTIQATLKVNGKGVKNKIIKFKFNKKAYKARTNAKGVAKIAVKKSVLKKLKKGKKITYTATYGKITKKVTVKVKK